jgi:ribonuclease P protein component, eubacterial
MKPGRLKSRPDFLAVQKGLRLRGPYFLVEMIDRGDPAAAPRIGYTVTRKQGNSVERNRMRRRLREAVRVTEGVSFLPGHDYVLVARRDCLDAPFAQIGAALAGRIDEGHRKLARLKARAKVAAADRPNTNAPDDEPAPQE